MSWFLERARSAVESLTAGIYRGWTSAPKRTRAESQVDDAPTMVVPLGSSGGDAAVPRAIREAEPAVKRQRVESSAPAPTEPAPSTASAVWGAPPGQPAASPRGGARPHFLSPPPQVYPPRLERKDYFTSKDRQALRETAIPLGTKSGSAFQRYDRSSSPTPDKFLDTHGSFTATLPAYLGSGPPLSQTSATGFRQVKGVARAAPSTVAAAKPANGGSPAFVAPGKMFSFGPTTAAAVPSQPAQAAPLAAPQVGASAAVRPQLTSSSQKVFSFGLQSTAHTPVDAGAAAKPIAADQNDGVASDGAAMIAALPSKKVFSFSQLPGPPVSQRATALATKPATAKKSPPPVAVTNDPSFDLYQQTLKDMDAYYARQEERNAQINAIQKKIAEHQSQNAAKLQRDWAAENDRIQAREAAVSKAQAEMKRRREILQQERERERQRQLEQAEATAVAAAAAARQAAKAEAEEATRLADERDDVGIMSDQEDDDDEGKEGSEGEEDEDEDDGDDDDDVDDGAWLSQSALEEAQRVMQDGDMGELIQPPVPPVNTPVTRRDLQCLRNGEWLNDEVINVWMGYIQSRNDQACAGVNERQLPSIYIMKTNFYSRMCEVDDPNSGKRDVFDFPGVRRWTKKVDVFSRDYIFVPLHQGYHWALAVVNLREKRLQYFDSMNGPADRWLKNIKRWLEEESKHKKQVEFDFSGWGAGGESEGLHSSMVTERCPQQHNGFDCGVFMCQNVKHLASSLGPRPFPFSQSDMPMIRWQMVHEIIQSQLV